MGLKLEISQDCQVAGFFCLMLHDRLKTQQIVKKFIKQKGAKNEKQN